MFNEIIDNTKALSVLNVYQSVFDEDRSSQFSEYWKNFTRVKSYCPAKESAWRQQL